MNEIPGRTAGEGRRRAAAARRDRVIERARERREASQTRQKASIERARRERRVTLVDLVDRLLDGGVVIHGDITLAVADVDLLYVGLRALVASVETMKREYGLPMGGPSPSLSASAL
jgi:hypothetical protein